MVTVLVVDGDAQVLAIVRNMLAGDQILSAGSAEEAVRVAMSHAGAIHLPFTGERLTEKVREMLTVKPPSSPFDRPPDPWRNV